MPFIVDYRETLYSNLPFTVNSIENSLLHNSKVPMSGLFTLINNLRSARLPTSFSSRLHIIITDHIMSLRDELRRFFSFKNLLDS